MPPLNDSEVRDPSYHAERGNEPTLAQIAVVLLRQRRLIARIATALVVAVVAFTLLRPRTYSAIASFVPNSAELPQAGVAGLAAQFGFAIPGGIAGQSPEFYAELLNSREILLDVIATEYSFVAKSGAPFLRDTTTVRGDLARIFEVEEDPIQKAHERTLETLRDKVGVGVGRQSGTVSITVATQWPALSQLIVSRMLALVEDFNHSRRQSQASAERQFVEERLAQTRRELRQAEDRLQKFLLDNRTFAGSPELMFQHERLTREVALHQQIVTGLAQSYEKARIDEVRNTPVITIVENPELPMLPDKRRLALKALFALAAGLLVGAVAGFTREMVSANAASQTETFDELRSLRQRIRQEIRRPWRLLMRDRLFDGS